MKYLIALALCLSVVVADISLKNQVPAEDFNVEVNPDGTYSYNFAAANGISVDENGKGGEYAQGSFTWTSPEGETFNVKYTADENGFQPEGDHLPTPPPVPELIQKALAYIEANPGPDSNPGRR
ncbi:endocuticle structural glycoprotein SgAbd-2-like [Culicoides brevitarsis]|uniref:endocuticle structural glycoprotein SgAbd-2-like n=1 Tax=Culicoides brevitarsis TaxID=469753 RepID=UPI00307C202B